MTPIRCIASFLSLAALLACWGQAAHAASYTFFSGTQYPLEVHFMTGEAPGPTVMVQGGIQGDETAGFLTAELLARARVRRGNLIVVPRANVPSISRGARQVNVDLNRRFDKDHNAFYEDRLARVIRYLVSLSDAFIHLHEGSGFYHPTYIDAQRNPGRYGQSVIIDTLVYGGSLDLGGRVRDVLERLNPSVVPADYRFRLFNTNTFAAGSRYAEQRKSLTCYALSNHQIPALAIEVSKSITQLEWKVREQLRATTFFLDAFGVEVEAKDPAAEHFAKRERRAPTVRINGQEVVPGPGAEVRLSAHRDVRVEAAPDAADPFAPVPAVFAPGAGDLDLTRTTRFALAPFSTLNVRSDGAFAGSVRVRWDGSWHKQGAGAGALFLCRVNGELRIIPAGRTLETVAGDQLVIEGVWGGSGDEVVNVKGLVTGAGRNDGQDAGTEIILDPETFIERYFLDSPPDKSRLCRVVRETPGKAADEFFIRIRPRAVEALKLVDNRGEVFMVPFAPDTTHRLPPGIYRLDDAWSVGARDKLLPFAGNKPLTWGESFTLQWNDTVRLTLRQATTFGEIGSMEISAAAVAALPTEPSAF